MVAPAVPCCTLHMCLCWKARRVAKRPLVRDQQPRRTPPYLPFVVPLHVIRLQQLLTAQGAFYTLQERHNLKNGGRGWGMTAGAKWLAGDKIDLSGTVPDKRTHAKKMQWMVQCCYCQARQLVFEAHSLLFSLFPPCEYVLLLWQRA